MLSLFRESERLEIAYIAGEENFAEGVSEW